MELLLIFLKLGEVLLILFYFEVLNDLINYDLEFINIFILLFLSFS